MSCKALVITTDGPPMNELVTADRGLLVEVAETEPRHLGTNFRVDSGALESAIAKTLSRPDDECQILGQAARRWALQNDHDFGERLAGLLNSLVAPPSS